MGVNALSGAAQEGGAVRGHGQALLLALDAYFLPHETNGFSHGRRSRIGALSERYVYLKTVGYASLH